MTCLLTQFTNLLDFDPLARPHNTAVQFHLTQKHTNTLQKHRNGIFHPPKPPKEAHHQHIIHHTQYHTTKPLIVILLA